MTKSEGLSNQSVQSQFLENKQIENLPIQFQSKGLPDTFKYDTKAPHPEANQKETEESSFLQKAIAWWRNTFQEIQAHAATPSQLDTISVQKPEALSPIPELDDPTSINLDQAIIDQNRSLLNQLKTKEDFLNFFKSLRDFMDKMMVLMKEQLEIEGEQTEISDELVQLSQKTMKSMDKLYDKLREDLEKDQNIANYLGYAHAALAFTTGAAAWMGYVPVLSVPAAIAGGADALTVAAKSYFDSKAQKNKAQIADIEFNKTNSRERAQDHLNQMSNYFDNAVNVYSTMARVHKSHHRMKSAVIRST